MDNPSSADRATPAAYPSLKSPVRIPLVVSADHPCPYLPDRTARNRAVLVSRMPPLLYHQFMDAGFRRSGRVIYQPACPACRLCVPVRLRVGDFKTSKSHRRCLRHNADLSITAGPPQPSDEKYELYRRYQEGWHQSTTEDRQAFESFLYESPIDTLEFEYRDPAGRLLAVGICDRCTESLSSVYFFYDPNESRRSLGTFGILHEIQFAAENLIPYYYLGYWVRGCRTMDYKAAFRPCQLLCSDGVWRDFEAAQGLE
ncbi:MAG: arginyltransferase [Phycisphaerales bacterium]|nr:arginyltransferase [Phycisphaerales bacterium]